MMDKHDLYEQGYYNHWYDANYEGDIVRADAEFDPDGELISIVIYELNDGEVGDIIKEILPKDVRKQHLQWIKKNWEKERVK